MSTSTPSAESIECIKKLLCGIRDAQQQQEAQTDAAAAAASLQPLLLQLRDVVPTSPVVAMTLLAPYLFCEKDSRDVELSFHLTRDEALSLVVLLVSQQPNVYLKPASRAVKAFAEQLNSTNLAEEQKERPLTIMISDQLLSVLVLQLSGNDVEVSANAEATLVACCRYEGPSLSERAIPMLTDAWKQVWSYSSTKNANANGPDRTTVAVRCASAVVGLACLHSDGMNFMIYHHATDLLLQMLTDTSDPLVQVSALDVLETLATTVPMHHTRAAWLFSNQVLHPLLVMAGEDEAPDPILGGPALRVLSLMCRQSQQDVTLFELGGNELLTGFHQALRNFQGGGELERLAVTDAISSFASASPEALDLVLSDPLLLSMWLDLNVAQPKLKSAILMSIVHVLDPPKRQPHDGATSSSTSDSSNAIPMTSHVPSNAVSLQLYSRLGKQNGRDATELLLSLAKSPVVVVRLGAYALLAAVAKRGTGAQVLLSHGGFFEFLTSREGERTKEGKEAKFAIVEAVLDSDAKNLLADHIVNALEQIVRQGPHYVKAQQWDVGTE